MTKRRSPKASRKATRRAQRHAATRKVKKRVPKRPPFAKTGSKRPSAKRPKRRVLDAVAKMRKGKSLTRAARSAHTTRDTVRKYASSVVVRTTGGRYKSRGYDRLTREMRFLTDEGVVALPIRSSASASRIGEYWNAVDRYLRTGKLDHLGAFTSKLVKVKGVSHKFVTDPRTLDRLANAGEVRFEDLYALTS